MASLGYAIKKYPLRKAIEAYWKFICLPIINKRRGSHLTLADIIWQMDDWEWTWDHEHACHCRSRGGSKTFDFIHYVSFRAIRTGEKWGWLTPKGGQLGQATLYFQESPLYKGMFCLTIGNVRKHFVELVDGTRILIGIVSTSNLGMRLDGLVIDEEEDMEHKQLEDVYPQMEGMMTDSLSGQFLHLGTLWVGSKYNDHTEQYPTQIRPWDKIPHLIASPKMQNIMKNTIICEWEKDLLYRCIPTAPGGSFFPSVILEDLSQHVVTTEMLYGLDYGSTDHCVGIELVGNHCYLLEELELDIERYPASVDFMKGKKVESEGGGYNVDSRYSAKGLLVQNRVGASLVAITQKWKNQRKMFVRKLIIHCDRNRTPYTTKDVKGATFGKDGFYLKDTAHPCHWLDAFLHALKANNTSYLSSPHTSRKSQILNNERERNMRNVY